MARVADQAVLAANDAFLLPDSEEAAKARAKAEATVGLAEFASFTVEWHALAARTGNASYADVADHVVHMLQQRHPQKVCVAPARPCLPLHRLAQAGLRNQAGLVSGQILRWAQTRALHCH